jgi:hypothetical protein
MGVGPEEQPRPKGKGQEEGTVMATLTYDEQAQNVLQAALRKADEIGVPSSVAVVDEGRELVAFAHQTGAGATQAPGNARGGRAGHPVPRL